MFLLNGVKAWKTQIVALVILTGCGLSAVYATCTTSLCRAKGPGYDCHAVDDSPEWICRESKAAEALQAAPKPAESTRSDGASKPSSGLTETLNLSPLAPSSSMSTQSSSTSDGSGSGRSMQQVESAVSAVKANAPAAATGNGPLSNGGGAVQQSAPEGHQR